METILGHIIHLIITRRTGNTHRTPPHTAHNPHFPINLLSYYRNTFPNGTDRPTDGQLDNWTATEHARVIIFLWFTNSIALWPIKLGQFMNWWHNLHLCCGFSFEIFQFSQFMLRCTLRVIRIVRFRCRIPTDPDDSPKITEKALFSHSFQPIRPIGWVFYFCCILG